MARTAPEHPPQGRGKHEWLAIGEASAFVGVSTKTLKCWAASGKIPSYRTLGGHLRYTNDLLALIEDRSLSFARPTTGKSLGIFGSKVCGRHPHRPLLDQLTCLGAPTLLYALYRTSCTVPGGW